MPRLEVVPRAITTKIGIKKVFVPRIPEDWGWLMDSGLGVCIACGKIHHGVEPDAEHYHCKKCHKNLVFGVPELATRGLTV